ncbi:DNA-processing protein DprA [Leptolyngbya ohadii]|uniref:DNA-processing protein DprA n=1 Tax=Leptolyngbya ohadii TaxID=1962290 RepID=UPI000B59ECBC|nr:DNA-processing protein DprA [Leptolyngbya ohadii]
MGDDRAYWVAWTQISGVGAILLRRLHIHFGSLAAAWSANPEELQMIEGVGWQTAESIAAVRSSLDPESLLRQHEQENPRFWTPADPDYPQLLLETPDPPPVLYYWGRVEPLENQGQTPCIAIVGTRNPSDYGRRWTRRIATALCEAGYTVVSGLADGIDTIAHHACLNAEGRTIAVLGTGVDVVYPWRNKELARQVRQHGLLLSEYPAGTQPDRVHFPRRNRIIAGLSRVTLVLEAPQKSGALITARLANEYGRDVYVLPNSLDNPNARGCLDLLNQGAALILGEAELLDSLASLPLLQFLSTNSQSASNSATHPTAQLSLLSGESSGEKDGAPIALQKNVPASRKRTNLDRTKKNSDQSAAKNANASPTKKTKENPSQESDELVQGLPDELRQVFDAVALEPVLLDQIVQDSGLTPGKVLSALTQLELMGLVVLSAGTRYSRV